MNQPISYVPTSRGLRIPLRGGVGGFRQLEMGTWLVLAVPLAAGVTSVKELYVGGVNFVLPPLMLFPPTALLSILLAKALDKRRCLCIPLLKTWLAWAAFVWLSLLWCDGVAKDHIEHAIFYTSPLAIGAAASLFIQDERQLRLLLRTFVGTLAGMFLLMAAVGLGLLEIGSEAGGPAVDRRPLAITAVLVGCVFLTNNLRLGLVGWAACLLLTALTGSRMATAALLAALLLRPNRGRLVAKCGAVVTLIIVALALFSIPAVQDRFLGTGDVAFENVVKEGIDSSGRAYAWPLIWEEAWQRPVLGAGVGSAVDFVPTVWDRMQSPHNDYLRVFFEFGLVGLALFLVLLLRQLRDLRRRMHATEGIVRWAFAAAWLGLLMFLLAACTDNPLGYSLLFTNPLFALIGAAYGVDAAQQARQRVQLHPLDAGSYAN